MLRKSGVFVIGLLLLVSPAFASADVFSDLKTTLFQLLGQITFLLSSQEGTAGGATGAVAGVATGPVYCPELTRNLRRGMSDATTAGQVSKLQRFLAEYNGIPTARLVTGYFGTSTRTHVVRFQRAHGLTAQGAVLEQTRAKIAEVCRGVNPIPLTVTSPQPDQIFSPTQSIPIAWVVTNPPLGASMAMTITEGAPATVCGQGGLFQEDALVGSTSVDAMYYGLGVRYLTMDLRTQTGCMGTSLAKKTVRFVIAEETTGSSNLTASVGDSPYNALVIAGTSMVNVGAFNFRAAGSPYTVQELKVKVPSGVSTSISSVTLKYKNSAGIEQSATQYFALPSSTQSHATATFTGLSFYIPADDANTLHVFADTATISSGATSGESLKVLLDGDEGFRAIDGTGVVDTTLTGSTLDISSDALGKGVMVIRKTVPMLSSVPLDTSTLIAGTDRVLARVKVTSDYAGDVDWGQVAFAITKTPTITLGSADTFSLWQGSTRVDGVFTMIPATAGDPKTTLVFRPTNVRTTPAGSSVTYELRGTVGGLGAGLNEITVVILPLSKTIVTGTFSQISGSGIYPPSFIWSDWSDVSDHAGNPTGASTLDWTNDTYVKTLPLIVGIKSVIL